MSDLMFYGVLRMPYEMAMSDELSRRQFYSRAQEAADRVERLEAAATAPKAAVPDGWRNWLPPKYEAWQDHFGVQRSAKSPDVISLIIERKEIQLYYPEFAYLLEKMLSFVAAATPSPVPADTAELPPDLAYLLEYIPDSAARTEAKRKITEYVTAIASRPAPVAEQGEVVVTWDEARTRIVAVTRQDEEGRVLSVIAHAAPAAPSAAQAAGVESLIEAAEDMMKWCVSNVTMWNFSQYDQLHRAVQRVRATTPSEGVAAPVEHEAKTTSKLTLAVIGRRHFGNPIPQEWYAAAHDLLADVAQAAPAQPSADQVASEAAVRDAALAECEAICNNVHDQYHAQRLIRELRTSGEKGGA